MQQSDNASCGVLSLLTPIGYQSGDCGYCKKDESSQRTPNSRAAYYVKAKSLCPHHYQILMDRGWRRSGTLLYIPDASRSCCPHYTIRLPAAQLEPSRDQRKALHRWSRFVLGEAYIKEVARKYPKSKAEKKAEESRFDLLTTVHEPEVSAIKADVEPEHKFTVTLEPDDFTEEKYRLFENYQSHVHHEREGDISRQGFKRFLCDSPVHRHTTPKGHQYGSYHQCYRLDGRLIAMSVLDLLPHAVSGVYFIYHSDFEKWSLGKLSAMREAALALEQGYEFYYMGYYIHGCKKMRYKGDFKPQYVLDYDSGNWDMLDEEMRSLMDRRKYASKSKEQQRLGKAPHRTGGAKEINGQVHGEQSDSTNGEVATARPEDADVLHPLPLEAANSGLSLLELGMPGILSLPELQRTTDLDTMKIFLGQDRPLHEMQDLVQWEGGSKTEPTSLKGLIAEFAAGVGPVIAKEGVLDFTR